MHCKCETVEEAAQWDSSSFKQISPVPAAGQPCTLLAEEINSPQQRLFEATGALHCRAPFPAREQKLHSGS